MISFFLFVGLHIPFMMIPVRRLKYVISSFCHCFRWRWHPWRRLFLVKTILIIPVNSLSVDLFQRLTLNRSLSRWLSGSASKLVTSKEFSTNPQKYQDKRTLGFGLPLSHQPPIPGLPVQWICQIIHGSPRQGMLIWWLLVSSEHATNTT